MPFSLFSKFSFYGLDTIFIFIADPIIYAATTQNLPHQRILIILITITLAS
jgi:hypothetical protein